MDCRLVVLNKPEKEATEALRVQFIRTICFCLARPPGVVKIFATGNKDFLARATGFVIRSMPGDCFAGVTSILPRRSRQA